MDALVALTVRRVLLCVCMLKECEGDNNVGVGTGEMWLW